jgi:adenylosuccinate synthase
MSYLNSRINQYEAKLKQTQNYLKAQEMEYEALLEKVWEFRNRYRKMALLLTEFVEHFVSQDAEILNRQSDIYLNIDEM